jgi:hypothetical protein
VARKRVEIRIAMEQRCAGSDGNGCDQAVRKSPDGGSLPPAGTVERRRGLVIGRFLEREEAAPIDQPAQIASLLLVPRPRKQLEQDKARRRERLVGRDRRREPPVNAASRRSLELDPRRGVDEDHEERG